MKVGRWSLHIFCGQILTDHAGRHTLKEQFKYLSDYQCCFFIYYEFFFFRIPPIPIVSGPEHTFKVTKLSSGIP